MSSLANLKLLLGIDEGNQSKDNLLNLYLSRATNFVKGYCNVTELNPPLDEVAEDIAVFIYRNKGIENVSSEGKGSLSESYRDGLPSEIYKRLNEYRRMKFV